MKEVRKKPARVSTSAICFFEQNAQILYRSPALSAPCARGVRLVIAVRKVKYKFSPRVCAENVAVPKDPCENTVLPLTGTKIE